MLSLFCSLTSEKEIPVQVKTVLVSQRDPATLSRVKWNLLRHFFGDDVILERTEIGVKDKNVLSALERPIVLPMTAEVRWSWFLCSKKSRPETAILIRMPDGFQMGLLPA